MRTNTGIEIDTDLLMFSAYGIYYGWARKAPIAHLLATTRYVLYLWILAMMENND